MDGGEPQAHGCLPCKKLQFLRVASGNSLLEPMSVKRFSPRYKLSTEDDGEPNSWIHYSIVNLSFALGEVEGYDGQEKLKF